ncbi:MAG: hypothetical protein OIN86_09250, partial [Candidatus Methanoperedens sp.]|nr:hypothetical protein [Candidatus Methanoperedens sp.]
HFPFSSHGSRPMRWDFNPADTNVIAHAVTFSSNVLFSTFFLVLRSTPIPDSGRSPDTIFCAGLFLKYWGLGFATPAL